MAPPDQQLDEIRPDERIHLEHLHPNEPTVDTQLPGCVPRVFVERDGRAQRIELRADTLWIDTNRLVQTLTWRGQLPLDDPAEAVRVLVAMKTPALDVCWDDVWQQAQAQLEQDVMREQDAAYVEKTLVQIPRDERTATSQRFTSPVPLVPSGDHTPLWMPPASSVSPHPSPNAAASSHAGSSATGSDPAPASLRTLELQLSEKEAKMLRELCQALGYDAVEMIRHALREAHQARFG